MIDPTLRHRFPRSPRSPLARSGGPPRRAARPRETVAVESLEPRQLLVADPVTVAHPLWFAAYGAVAVDGVIDAAEWADAVPVTRSQPSRPDASVTMWFKYTELGLYVAADVQDRYLWADGTGGGRGGRSDWGSDDALALFFDASVTRKRLMTPNGRALMFNIGSWNGPTNGSGVVSRVNYLRGNNPTGIDGDRYGVQLHPGGAVTPGMYWRTILNGTPNNNSDIDQGWTTEVFLPWATINMPGMPVNGQNITMNFTVMFDDDGGGHNSAPQESSANPALRFGPAVLDDQINGVDSSFNVASPGMEGPIDYAWLTFIDARTSDRPNPVINLSVGVVDGYTTRLEFLAPAASSAAMALGPYKRGHVYQYQIRWSEFPFTDEFDWETGTDVPNTFQPHPRGQPESLHIGGLEPGVTYHFAIRAVDIAGRLGPIQQVSFTTQTELQDTSYGQRLMTSPLGGTLVTAFGNPFFINGSETAPDDLYIRNLYPASVRAADGSTINYSSTPGAEGDAAGYFAALDAYGINTLRVPLEQLSTGAPAGSNVPASYWLESSPGNYNPAMRQFLWNLMEEGYQAGVSLVLRPFDTANYAAQFARTAYAAQNGGPLSTINDFFQSSAIISMAAARINTIVDWIAQSPYSTTIVGIELPGEWDSLDWTINPRGNGDPTRMQEWRDRSKVTLRIAKAVHLHDPNTLLISSSTDPDPRGAVARALFLGDNIDILAPSWNTATVGEPIHNPDRNPSIRPAFDYAALSGYWLTSKRDQRVVNNTGWGADEGLWPGESTFYSGISPGAPAGESWGVQNDIDLFRTTMWTQIAMGMSGTGIRATSRAMLDLIPADLSPHTTGYMPTPLPMGMRRMQQVASEFIGDWTLGFDYASYRPTPLGHRASVVGTPKHITTMGSSDGDQGMVYVSQNLNETVGFARGASLLIDGLRCGDFVDYEIWSTDQYARQLEFQFSAEVVNGRLTIPLPDFNRDLVVRFKVESWWW